MHRRRKVSINNVIYGSPIQSSPFRILPHNLRSALNDAIRQGGIFVAAAGNYGPLPGTINPFAKIDKAIVVGGAKNDGSDLCNFSSRGTPGIKFSGPTIVCPSENLIGMTHSRITSILEQQQKLAEFKTKERYEYQVNRSISDEEWKFVEENNVVGTGTSQAVEYLVNIISWIIYFRNQREFVSDIKVIRNILIDMAIPIKNYQNHEIGAGFVDFRIADKYLIEIDKGHIPKNQNEIWSSKYYLPEAKRGDTHIYWYDNINHPDQISFVDNKDYKEGGFDIGIKRIN